ncbi:MAG TPA: histidine phosphatase family protein [Acidimicrobiia bacterium]|nr:histidine phosphatase family protein [Acidimicrobiia bacterium]
MELVLVRHAEPIRIASGSVDGPADPALTPAGHEQSARLAAWLAHEAIDAVVTSPQRRAVETAAPVGAALGLDVEIVDGIAEYDWRADHYIPTEELARANDGRWRAMLEGRWEEFGGDPPEVFRARIDAAVDDLVAKYAGGRVVAVCHGGVINCAVARVIGLDQLLWFNPAYTSIHRIMASRSGVRSLVSLNETAHLEAVRARPTEVDR